MTRRKDGRWQQSLVVTERGRKVTRFFYGKTKSEVLKKIAAYKEKAERRRTFSVVADEWFEESSADFSANTRMAYTAPLNRAKLYFGDMDISLIRPVDVRRFITEYVRDNHASDKSARMQLSVVSLVCRHGLNCGDLDFNPAAGVTVPRNLPKKKRELPSDEDIKRVKESTDLPLGMFAFWVLYTGCRRGELLALTWQDIDLKARTVTIRRSVYHDTSGHPHFKDPKTAAGIRTVPLLDKLYERVKDNVGIGLIFPGDNGQPLTSSQFYARWTAYAAEAGITATPHQFRHAYATMLFEADISPKDAQELLGHAQLCTTEDIYTHLREQRRAEVRTKLLSVDIA